MKGGTRPERLQRADYNLRKDKESGHPGLKNVISNIPRLSSDEIVREDENSESGRDPMINVAQEHPAMKYSVGKFSKPV